MRGKTFSYSFYSKEEFQFRDPTVQDVLLFFIFNAEKRKAEIPRSISDSKWFLLKAVPTVKYTHVSLKRFKRFKILFL